MCAQSNSILKTSPQKYRSYVLVPFFVTNYISRIFATSMKPRRVITVVVSPSTFKIAIPQVIRKNLSDRFKQIMDFFNINLILKN